MAYVPGRSQFAKASTKPHQMTVDQLHELVVDNFAGGGGASTGIALALGRSVDIAINHNPQAIAMHRTNHPDTKHYCESVWDVDPLEVTQGLPVGLGWFSPDCTHHSKARGGKPREKGIRGLAWVMVKWAALVDMRVGMLENVEEFQDWGPIDENGKPIKERKGETFRAFVACLSTGLAPDHPAWEEIRETLGEDFPYHLLEQGLGYAVEWKELRACDYGAPTIRKRLFLIARCDGRPIVWPRLTHGDPKSDAVQSGKLQPWRTAADIIDWSLPCPSIFERKKPLAENTLKRIAKGLQRFVIDNPKPFIVQVNYSGAKHHYTKTTDAPLSTITSKNGWGLVTPLIVGAGGPVYSGKPKSANEPMNTLLVENHSHLVTAFLAQYHTETTGHNARGQTMDRPILTVDTANRYGLVTSNLIKLRGTCADGQLVTEPMPTITAGGLHVGEVRAFLLKYYGDADNGQSLDEPLHTVTSRDRFGLVTIEGQDYRIVDIGMRMLQPKELFAASGFPEEYIIDRDLDGNEYTKEDQVARCGNAVPPNFAQALVEANLPEMCPATLLAGD